MKKAVLLIVIVLSLFQSCSFDTAKNYFDRTTLNTNKLSYFGSRELKMKIEEKEANSLLIITQNGIKNTKSFEKHVKEYILPNAEKEIEKIEALKPTEETEAMIAASLKLWNFAKEKYETDYIEIAKLIDKEGDHQEEIMALLTEFDKKNLPQLNALREKLMSIALPYAKENGIKVNGY